MPYREQKIILFTKKLLFTFTISLSIILGLSIFASYSAFHRAIESDVRTHVGSANKLFSQYIDQEIIHLKSLLEYCSKNNDFQKLYLEGARKELFKQAYPLFKDICQKYNITHFYFIRPDKTCFLRIHKPESYGDQLHRHTLSMAVDTGKTQGGIELGTFGTFTLRVVMPWKQKDKVVGYIEYGKEIEHITPALKSILGFDLFFLINKRFLDREKWQEGLEMVGKMGSWSDLQSQVIIDRTTSILPADFVDKTSLSRKEKEGCIIRADEGRQKFYGGFVPLKAVSGKQVGEILLFRDYSSVLSQLMVPVYIQIFCMIMGLVLIITFTFFCNRQERRINRIYSSLVEEVNAREKSELALKNQEQKLEETVDLRTAELSEINTLLKEEISKHQITEKRLQAILDNTTAVIYMKDLSGKYLLVNKQFQKVTLLNPEQIIGKTDSDIFPEELVCEFQANDRTVIETKQVHEFDEKVTIAGEVHIFLSIKFPIHDSTTGEIIAICGISSDITPRKNAESELKKARESLEKRVEEQTRDLQQTYRQLLHAEKLGAVGSLSASIAHEFNNPLFGIMTVIKGIKERQALDDEDSKLIDMALSECRRMKDFVNDLQDFNRPTTGQPVPTNIQTLIDSVLLLCMKDLKNREISIVKEYTESLPTIEVIPDQIKQVILNMITNAADACDNKHQGTIIISTSCDDQQVMIALNDNGKGMEQETIKHIFDPFYTTKEDTQGTGLGLSVSYGIIKRHKGFIDVTSIPGEGTTFTVNLPLKRATND